MRLPSGLLFVLLIGAALAAIALLLFDGDLGDATDSGYGSDPDAPNSRTGDARTGDGDGAHLAPAPGAKSAEERAAERARAEAALRTGSRAESVFGRVTDARSRPIAEAVVRLGLSARGLDTWGTPEPPAIATSTTDELGYFQVGPAPEGILRVRAEASGYAPSVHVVRRRGCRVDFILDLGGALEVKVKTRKGEALEGAFVIHRANRVVTDVHTDEAGVATFPGLPTGTGALIVTHDEHASVRQEGVAVAPGKTERMTVVLGEPILVKGRVVEDATERPVMGARIRARAPRLPWMKAVGPLTTDADGRFEFAATAPVGQSLEVNAEAKGHVPARRPLTVADSGDGTTRMEIRLTSGAVLIRGEVQDIQGRPAPGVHVGYVDARSSNRGGPETETDKHGWFRLPAPPWAPRRGSRVQVVASSPSLGIGSTYAQIPKADEEAKPAHVRLSGIGAVRGRVTDDSNAPVVGALVSLDIDWRATMERAKESSGALGGRMLASALRDPRRAPLDAVTDADGRFAIEGVPAALFLLTAQFGLERITSTETLEVLPGGTVQRDVVLGTGATIEGWVRDPDGHPVPGAYVTAWPTRRDLRRSPASVTYARSQSDGAFLLRGVTADAYGLRASAAGYQSNRLSDVEPGSVDLVLTLQALGWLSGVVQHEGRPYEGTFTVMAQRVGGKRVPFAPATFPMGGGRTNTFNTDDGSFRVRNLREGEYDVTVQTPEGMITADAQRVKLVDGRETKVALMLSGGAVLKGSVVDDETGNPVADARVRLQPVPGPEAPKTRGWGRTDAEGRFLIRSLGGGRYTIRITPPKGAAFFEPVELERGLEHTIRVHKKAPGIVRVRVRDEKGAPVAGITPRIRTPSGNEVWPDYSVILEEWGGTYTADLYRRVTQTDDTGVNVRRHVPPGQYEVTVWSRSYEPVESQQIEVASRRTTDVEIVVRPLESRLVPPPGGRR